MILEKQKIAFAHIPRTGGTSIKSMFGSSEQTHMRASEIIQKLGPKRPDYFIFGFVRNPWDLMVSSYFYLKQSPEAQKLYYPIALDQDETFADWVNRRLSPIPRVHGLLFGAWLGIKDKLSVDFVGKLETIDQDMRFILQYTKQTPADVPHLKATDRESYRQYYDDKTKDLVWLNYHKDICAFEYEF